MKKITAFILAAVMLFSLAACGKTETSYGVKNIQTLVKQEYSIAFRNDDNLYYYVTGALQVLAANGTIDELAIKWLGSKTAVSFNADSTALDNLPAPEARTLLVGVDIDSFPFVYIDTATGSYWGFDIQLAQAVCDYFGWTLKALTIKKENVYDELTSGNIDVAWGGIALDEKETESGQYTQYGPYIENEICIGARQGNVMSSLKGLSMAMPSTTEALEAVQSDKKIIDKLGNVFRLSGGTTECFTYLYSGKCDIILTDSTAIMYYNCH